MVHNRLTVRRAGALAIGAFAALGSIGAAQAQPAAAAPAGDPNAAMIAALQTYQLPDQTASVRLPANWRVVATGIGFIAAKGPNGELALFGVLVPAQEAAAAGISQSGITLPYASDPKDEFLESINWVRARNGKSAVQAVFYSSKPVAAPPAFGKCSNLTAVLNGAIAVETDFCSLPLNGAGKYRNFFKLVGLPVQAARQERSLMEAILASYRLNLAAIKRATIERQQAAPSGAGMGAGMGSGMGAGMGAAPAPAENSQISNQLMMQEANAINAETIANQEASDQSVNDFDHGVLRGDTPIYAQGMSEPMFWVGN